MPFVSHNPTSNDPNRQPVSGTGIKNQHLRKHSQSEIISLLQQLTTVAFPNPNLQTGYLHRISMLGYNSKHDEESLHEFSLLVSSGGSDVKNYSDLTDPTLCAWDEGLEHIDPNMASHWVSERVLFPEVKGEGLEAGLDRCHDQSSMAGVSAWWQEHYTLESIPEDG